MSVTNRLVFDPAEPASHHNVGSYVRAGDDGTLIGHVSDALKVSIENASIVVTATDLDIRDLTAASDSVAAWLSDGSGNAIGSTAGALDVNIASGSLTVTESDVFAEDSAHTTGDDGTHLLSVRQDTLASSTSTDGDYGSIKANAKGEIYIKDTDVLAQLVSGITVSATDLDIRDLTAASDSVAAWLSDGSGNAIGSTAGALDVNIASGFVDADDSLGNTAIENATTAVSTTAVNVVTSALASRKWLYLANNGNKGLFIGKTGVTTSNGFPLFPGQQAEFRLGPSVAMQAIGETGASSEDLRVMEIS